FDMVEAEIGALLEAHLPGRREEAWDMDEFLNELGAIFPLTPEITPEKLDRMNRDQIEALVLDEAEEAYDRKEAEMGAEAMQLVQRLLMLQTIDRLWVEHLTAMDELRQGIGLQAYGQQDPLVMYKREAHDMWQQLLATIQQTVTRGIYHVALANAPVF